MKIIVGKHDIRLENDPINEKEMNINSCEFEFDEDITSDFNKEAYFTKDNNTYKMIILDNACEIPNEVLASEGKVELGVSYFKIENNETTRYNPSPTYFYVLDGSLKDKTKNGLSIKTPSELEQFEDEIEDYIKTLNIDIDVSKEGNTTTITATNANGEHHSVEIYDGLDGEPGPAGRDGVDGYSPSASVSKSGSTATITITDKNGTTTANVNDGVDGRDGQDGQDGYTPVKGVDYFTQEDIASLNIPDDTSDLTNGAGFITNAVNDLTNYYLKSETYTKTEVDTLIGNINQFKIEIVNSLPVSDIDTHTIYLVPKTGSTGDVYNEYIYINNNWELIGSTEVDLSNYYTKSETDTLLSAKANSSSLSTVATSGSYSDLSNTPTIPSDLGDLTNNAGYIKNLYIAEYGISTYTDVRNALDNNKIVYCKVSPNSTSSRMAFLAYYQSDYMEFQYYRSVSSHSDSQQGDEIYIYKLQSNGTWSTTTRQAYTKVKAGTNMTSSYVNGTITLNSTNTTYESKTAESGGTDVSLVTTGEKYTWNNKQDTLVSGTSIKTINNESVLGSGNISISGGATYTAGNFLNIDANNKIDENFTHTVSLEGSTDIGKDSSHRLDLNTLKCGKTIIQNYSASSSGMLYYQYNATGTDKTSSVVVSDGSSSTFMWINAEIDMYHTVSEYNDLSAYQILGTIKFYTSTGNKSNIAKYNIYKYTTSTPIRIQRNNGIIDGENLYTTFEEKGNKVTSISSSSTDTQYPSAKCVYDAIYGALNSNY